MDLSDSGAIITVASNPSVPSSPIIVGGIFGPKESKGNTASTDETDSSDDAPYPAKLVYPVTPNLPTPKTKCIISTDMMSVNACLKQNTPSACCEGIYGAAHAVLQVSHDEFLMGGSFAASVSMKFEAEAEPPPTPGGGTPPDSSEQEAVQPKSETGYQNFQRFFVPRLKPNGAVSKQHANEIKDMKKMTGGPNGEVMSVVCLDSTDNVTHKVEPYGEDDIVNSWRCTDVIVAGRFDSWESYYMNETTMMTILNETATFNCKQGIARLTYDFDHKEYKPYPLTHDSFPDIALNRTNVQILTSVNYAIQSEDGTALYAGGEFAKFNNLYKMTGTSISPIPAGDSSTPAPDDPFYKCMNVHEKNQTGEEVFVGANFCCRSGSYCPDLMVDVPCPLGWGYSCKPENITVCKKGTYCPTPGASITCPKGTTCPKGSDHPLVCFWWEFCIFDGMR